MPGLIHADTNHPGFVGLYSIFQYVNNDGVNPANVCGQAACATLLTYCGYQAANIQTLRRIEASHPPDVLWGVFGTSSGRIGEILRAYGAHNLEEVSTVDALKRRTSQLCPVICLIQNSEGVLGLGDGAHWFVVFAHDNDGVSVTNYGGTRHLPWTTFEKLWSSPVSEGMDLFGFKGITNTSRILPDLIPPLPRNMV